jgi:hydroxypyruvate reductase
MDPRPLLLELYDAALGAVDGRECVAEVLRQLGAGPVSLFAVGKAASAMIRGAYDALGDQIERALLITKDDHVDPELLRFPNLRIIESAHPVPDERSLEAGAALESEIAALPTGTHPVFLVSGGASSLAELLQPGVTLDELRALNTRGLAAGWDIAQLNAERAKLSRLKQGGVARLLGGRPAHALFISDVPDDSPTVIGSGLLGADGDRPDRVLRIVVANIDVATAQAAIVAEAHGLEAEVRRDRFSGEASVVAEEFMRALRASPADVLIWGGESTVTLPERAGRGGRNQHLALLIARALKPNENFTILAAGTDGTDGPTDDAGAIVDTLTIDRAELGGVDVDRSLRDFNSGLALEAAEDLLHTGPTGTNVGDLLIGLRKRDPVRDPAFARVI